MTLEAKPYRRQPFDRDEKIYLLKVAILIAVIYFFRRELASLIGFAWLFAPFFLFAYVWFQSLHTGDRVIDILRRHITLMPVTYAEGRQEVLHPLGDHRPGGAQRGGLLCHAPAAGPRPSRTILNQFCFLPVAEVGWNYLLSPLASLFLHADAGHLWGNMAFLWAFAPAVEERLGARIFVGLYLLTGIIGGLTYIVVMRLFFSSARARHRRLGRRFRDHGHLHGPLLFQETGHPRPRVLPGQRQAQAQLAHRPGIFLFAGSEWRIPPAGRQQNPHRVLGPHRQHGGRIRPGRCCSGCTPRRRRKSIPRPGWPPWTTNTPGGTASTRCRPPCN